MATEPDVKHHPNQESKSGRPPYASPVKKNSSTNDPTADTVVGGVEEKLRKELKKARKSKASHGKNNISGKNRPDSDR
jgi:hypothetical protein